MRPPEYNRFRTHVADEALLLFRPSTGDSIRIAARRFRNLRASAPRAVFVGLSHACNLECWFCSRDAGVRDRWTAGDMLALLTQLAKAGTLEVAFGGGEPLVYAGFVDLLERLAVDTPLALHFTTNGTLVDAPTAARLAPLVGEVRVSIYESTDWIRAIGHLCDAGIQVGANIVVARGNVGGLVPLLATLDELGCDNAALLRYLGPDESVHLAGSDWVELEHAIRTSPLNVRLSRCFADRMPAVPRFRWTHDCGAGRDFLVIDPDSHVRACSFHHHRSAFVDAEDLLSQFRDGAAALASPANAVGCARPLQCDTDSDVVHVFRGFASNNSGDTVLVARFETEREPSKLLERLADLDPETDRQAWARFLSDEGCEPHSAHIDPAISVVGRTLLATGYDADDALRGLREVVTRRGAQVVHTEVHTHESPTLLAAVGLEAGSESGADLQTALWVAGADEVQRHGGALFATFPSDRVGWQEHLAKAREAANAAPFSAELIGTRSRERLVDGCKTLVEEDEPGFFQGWFYKAETARAFADSVDLSSAQAGATVILPVTRFRKRLAVRAHEAGGLGCWLPKAALQVTASFYHRNYRQGDLPPEQVEKAIQTASGVPTTFALTKSYRAAVAKAVTTEPLPVLEEVERIAASLDVAVSVTAAPANPMAHALGRVKRGLAVLK